MSGPVRPPLTVTTASGTPSGRPITTIKVSDGDLTISGGIATLDTSGTATTPGGSTTEIQYNNAGAFAGDAGFKMQTEGGGSTTKIRVGDIFVGSTIDAAVQATQNGNLRLSPEGSGQLTISSNNDAGGTMTDMQVNITAQSATDDPILKFGNLSAPTGEIRLDGATGDFLISALGTNDDLDLKVNGTGQVEVANTTTNNDTTLSVKGNGTGKPVINLSNNTKSASLEVTTNEEMTIAGGSNSFKFDVSSATGGITFPDSTVQTTAASGGASSIGDLSDATTPASGNIGLGTDALTSLASGGNYNYALGEGAGTSVTTGDYNVYIGYRAGFDNVTQGENIGIGKNTLKDSTGRWNTAIGATAGLNAGDDNVAIGRTALAYGISSDKNVAVGYDALRNASGQYNISLGYKSGDSISTGDFNVVIGGLDVPSATADSQLMISNGDGTQKYIEGDSTGSCYQGDNSSTWSTTSDRRLKTNIADIDSMLDKINQVGIKTFNYIEKAEPIIETVEDEDGEINEKIVGYDGENRYNLDPEPTRVGVIAQELQEVFPDAVKENAFGHLTVNPDSINWALIKAVQELTAKVEALEAAQ